MADGDEDDDAGLEEEIYDTKASISTPLDDDINFTISKIKAFEAISQPFSIEIFMHANASDIQELEDDIFESFIGQECSITINFYTGLDDESDPHTKYFHGVAGELTYMGEKLVHEDVTAQYKLTLYPKFWTLKYQKDFRIFQGETSLEIIEDIFTSDIDHDILVDEEDDGIEQRDYCVQYGETTFDFLSRLMEEDGVFTILPTMKMAIRCILGTTTAILKILKVWKLTKTKMISRMMMMMMKHPIFLP